MSIFLWNISFIKFQKKKIIINNGKNLLINVIKHNIKKYQNYHFVHFSLKYLFQLISKWINSICIELTSKREFKLLEKKNEKTLELNMGWSITIVTRFSATFSELCGPLWRPVPFFVSYRPPATSSSTSSSTSCNILLKILQERARARKSFLVESSAVLFDQNRSGATNFLYFNFFNFFLI